MIADHLANPTLSVTASSLVARIQDQTEATGWGKKLEQLHGELKQGRRLQRLD